MSLLTVGLCLCLGPSMAFMVDDLLLMLVMATAVGICLGLLNLAAQEIYSRYYRRPDG